MYTQDIAARKQKNIASPKVSKSWFIALLRRCINRKHQLHKDSFNELLLHDEDKR